MQRIFAAPDWAAHPPLVALQREAAALSEQAGQVGLVVHVVYTSDSCCCFYVWNGLACRLLSV